MAIEKKLICFARLEEFERQLAAGNIKDYSIILIQDAKKIYNRGTYYDCSGITQEQGDERYLRKITEGDMTVSGIDQIRNPSSGMTYAFSESGNGNEDGIILTSDITKTINGQSLLGAGDITIEGGSADNVYIADFTVNDLQSIAGRDQESIQCQMSLLYEAVVAHKIILVPYDTDEGFQGYGVAVGYCEDMIYLTVLLDIQFIDLELDLNIDEINGSQVGLRSWYDKQDRLVSGTNIKTINGQPILGSGNISIQGGEINVNSDWLEPDNTVDSYVKNRTHYLTGTKITSAGSYSIGTSTPIYYKEKRYNLEIGVRTQIDTAAAGVYVTLGDDGILLVEDIAGLLRPFPIMAISGVVPLDDMFIPETIARTSELKTINGESIVGSGDLTIEGGAKIYTWSPTITSTEDEDTQISGTFTEEEYYNILNADVLYIKVDGQSIFCIARGINSENGEGILITGSQITTYADFAIDISLIKEDGVFTGTISEPIPSKTSQLENDSNFISSDNLKTINGESILGSGNISISGGSGGGSSAYSEVNHGTSDTTFTLTPNTFHVWDEVSELTLTLGSETSGVANEFLFQFTSGATATSLTLPEDIQWANDSAPTIAENMIYQISILNKIACVIGAKYVNKISFYVNGVEFYAEEGMTWAEWCLSKYNTKQFVNYGSYIFATYPYSGYIYESPNSQITPNTNYTIAQGSGGGN